MRCTSSTSTICLSLVHLFYRFWHTQMLNRNVDSRAVFRTEHFWSDLVQPYEVLNFFSELKHYLNIRSSFSLHILECTGVTRSNGTTNDITKLVNCRDVYLLRKESNCSKKGWWTSNMSTHLSYLQAQWFTISSFFSSSNGLAKAFSAKRSEWLGFVNVHCVTIFNYYENAGISVRENCILSLNIPF